MVGLDVLGRLADGPGSEFGSGSVGHAAVVGDAIECPVNGALMVGNLFNLRKAAEGSDPGEAGSHAGVGEGSAEFGVGGW